MDGGTAKDAWKAVGVVLFVMLVAVAGWWFAYGSKVLANDTMTDTNLLYLSTDAPLPLDVPMLGEVDNRK